MGFLMISMAFGGIGGGLRVVHLTSLGIAYSINIRRRKLSIA